MHLEERDDDALPEVTDSISVLSSSSSSGFVVERSSLHKKRSKTSRVKKRTEKAGTVGVAIGNNQHTLLTEGKKYISMLTVIVIVTRFSYLVHCLRFASV